MIKHVVCFKLKEPTAETLEKAQELLLSMKCRVPEVKDIRLGLDILHSERSYDIILEVIVEDLDALNSYQNNEYHCSAVKTYMHAVRESSVAIDYYI